MQAANRDNLRELLAVASGGVVVTTIHKFMPEKGEAMVELSACQNIVVIADEAHRCQYGFGGKVNEKTGETSYCFASNLRENGREHAGGLRRLEKRGDCPRVFSIISQYCAGFVQEILV